MVKVAWISTDPMTDEMITQLKNSYGDIKITRVFKHMYWLRREFLAKRFDVIACDTCVSPLLISELFASGSCANRDILQANWFFVEEDARWDFTEWEKITGFSVKFATRDIRPKGGSKTIDLNC